MTEKDTRHYTESIIYAMDQTVIYIKVKGAQIFNELNLAITLEQFIALDTIFCNNDICQRDLSKLILKDRSNTGRILNILEKNGFIKRTAETKGKRLVKKIHITEEGKKIVEENQERLRNAFVHAFEDISDEEFTALRSTLNKIKNGLSKVTTLQI